MTKFERIIIIFLIFAFTLPAHAIPPIGTPAHAAYDLQIAVGLREADTGGQGWLEDTVEHRDVIKAPQWISFTPQVPEGQRLHIVSMVAEYESNIAISYSTTQPPFRNMTIRRHPTGVDIWVEPGQQLVWQLTDLYVPTVVQITVYSEVYESQL